jgi:hypothetical protein
MSQQVTIQVSDEVVRHATEVATQTRRPIEAVLAAWLESVVNELPVEQLPDNEVLVLTALQLTDQQQDALSELLALNREGTIEAAQQRYLDELMRLYEHGLLRKAQALRVAVQRKLLAPLQL